MDRNILISTVVILLLTAFIGANFVYEPKSRQLRRLEQGLAEEEEFNSLSNEISSLEKRLQLYHRRLMEKGKEEVELVDRVRDIAKEVPVKVVSMVPIPVRRGKGFDFVSLKIIFEGSYHQLGTFVAKVENSEKYIRVNSIQFSASHGSDSSMVHELEVSTLRQP